MANGVPVADTGLKRTVIYLAGSWRYGDQHRPEWGPCHWDITHEQCAVERRTTSREQVLIIEDRRTDDVDLDRLHLPRVGAPFHPVKTAPGPACRVARRAMLEECRCLMQTGE